MNDVEVELSLPQYEIFSSTQQVNLALMGVGSGKTHLGGLISFFYLKHYPEAFGFIGANTYDQLNTSTLYRIREVWKSFGLVEWTPETPHGVYVSGRMPPAHFNTELHNFDSYNSIISFVNGAIIFKGGLENAKAHEGKQFAWAILDETKDTREEDVRDIILARLRQQVVKVQDGQFVRDGKFLYTGEIANNAEPFNPVYFLTSPSKAQWLSDMFELENNVEEIEQRIYSKTNYFKKTFANKKVVICSTYHNIKNLPSNYIDNFKLNNSEERIKALIYGSPFGTTGAEFYSSFSRLNHVASPIYNKKLPLHISFDQNTVPYNSCLISHIYQSEDGNWCVDFVGEITLKNPRNSTEEVCQEVLRQYGDCDSIFFYGDASGANRSTLNKNERHHYQVIERLLHSKLVSSSNRVKRSNPSIIKRRDFINKIFEGKLPIRIRISDNCHNLLADLTYIKQDIDGRKKKEVAVNPDTQERYQKHGHLSDCMDYLLTSAFESYFVLN